MVNLVEQANGQYREINKTIRKKTRKAKKDWINRQCNEIENSALLE